MLLDAGANINASYNYDMPSNACYSAIRNGQFDALKLLVERGATLRYDVKGFSCTLLAIVARKNISERFAILLLDAGAPLDGLSNGELMKLVKSGAVLDRLMARGVNLTAIREYGATLCHHVASNVTSEDDLRFLVNFCGKDAIHASDDYGKTPFHWASMHENESAMRMRVLVELGADIDRQDNNGWTALHLATGKVPSSCVELLLAFGADVDVGINSGETACHVAASWQKPASLCALLAAGGDLDRPNKERETPRMIAIRERVALPTADEIDAACRRIAKTRLDLVRERAFQICLGLQPLNINALQLCEILMHSFGAIGSVIAFHQWWAIAVKVKHFRDHKQQSSTRTTPSATNNETKTP
jgi:ankyrin repeat protein